MPRHYRIGLLCSGLAVFMLGLSFAAVPLYDAFCRLTGFGGTPRSVTLSAVPGHGAPIILAREMEIRFDANIAPDLPWHFAPNASKLVVKVGDIFTTSYRARNLSNEDVIGRATFNVVPEQAAYYFSKIQCFCFQEQKLKAGQEVDMPITFFVDPDIAKDSHLDDIKSMTLSYTFHAVAQEAKGE